MKKKIWICIISLLTTFCVFGTNTASAAITSKLRVNLCGIKDSDGNDRTGWQTVAYAWMSKLDANVYKRTEFDKNQLVSYIKSSDIFVIHTHGGYDYLLAVDGNGNETNLEMYNVDSWASNCLLGLDLAFLGACECGRGGESARNMVNSFFNKGARCVIGYEWSVDTKVNYTMIQEFCRAIGAGYTIKNALAYADIKVLDKHGYPGWTNSRYVRGDTSVKFRNVTQLLSSLSTENVNYEKLPNASEIVYFHNEEKTYGFFDPSKVDGMNLNQNNEKATANNLSQREISDNYLKSQIGTWDKYQLTDSYYTEDTGLTAYIYSRKIHGVNTWDTVGIFVNRNNEIVSYSAPRIGAFDAFNIEAYALSNADIKLQDKMRELGIFDYEIVEKMVILEDNLPAMRYSVLHTIYDEESEHSSIDDYIIALND